MRRVVRERPPGTRDLQRLQPLHGPYPRSLALFARCPRSNEPAHSRSRKGFPRPPVPVQPQKKLAVERHTQTLDGRCTRPGCDHVQDVHAMRLQFVPRARREDSRIGLGRSIAGKSAEARGISGRTEQNYPPRPQARMSGTKAAAKVVWPMTLSRVHSKTRPGARSANSVRHGTAPALKIINPISRRSTLL